jgi:hypothetical protein
MHWFLGSYLDDERLSSPPAGSDVQPSAIEAVLGALRGHPMALAVQEYGCAALRHLLQVRAEGHTMAVTGRYWPFLSGQEGVGRGGALSR